MSYRFAALGALTKGVRPSPGGELLGPEDVTDQYALASLGWLMRPQKAVRDATAETPAA